jgi:hypothetical protein
MPDLIPPLPLGRGQVAVHAACRRMSAPRCCGRQRRGRRWHEIEHTALHPRLLRLSFHLCDALARSHHLIIDQRPPCVLIRLACVDNLFLVSIGAAIAASVAIQSTRSSSFTTYATPGKGVCKVMPSPHNVLRNNRGAFPRCILPAFLPAPHQFNAFYICTCIVLSTSLCMLLRYQCTES